MDAYVTGSDYDVVLQIELHGETRRLPSSSLVCSLLDEEGVQADRKVVLRLAPEATKDISFALFPSRNNGGVVQRVEVKLSERAWQQVLTGGIVYDRQSATKILIQDAYHNHSNTME